MREQIQGCIKRLQEKEEQWIAILSNIDEDDQSDREVKLLEVAQFIHTL